jgi:hypothetical protein
MPRPRRLAPILLAGLLLAAPAIASAAGPSVKEIRGIARSGVTTHLLDVFADKPPSGGGGGGGGKPGGGGGLVPSTWTNVNASLAITNAAYSGLPANEPFVAASGSTLIAGANDYRSGNGQGQAAVYVSSNSGHTWSGAFLQKSQAWDDATNHGSGDPWLAFGSGGRAYFSAIYFNFDTNCDGGVYLVPAASASALSTTGPVLVTANDATRFEDKSAVAVLPGGGTGGQDKVAVTWTRFAAKGCTDTAYYDSPILVAVSLDGGATFAAPIQVPAPTLYSQGSFPVFDPATGDLYVAYENWANATDVNGRIVVARIPASGTGTSQVVANITDLPSPLPGTKFRTDSFPALAIAGGQLAVTWAERSASGFSQVQLATHSLGDPTIGTWSTRRVDSDVTGTALGVAASDRFFTAVAASGNKLGLVWLDRRDDSGNKKYRAWGAFFTVGSSGSLTGGTNVPIGTVQSDPSKDPFFRGQFIGDYIGAAYDGSGTFHPVWTDMRSSAPRPYRGNTQEIWSAYP